MKIRKKSWFQVALMPLKYLAYVLSEDKEVIGILCLFGLLLSAFLIFV